VTIEYRWAEGRYDRLPALAADLVGRKVDVIAVGAVSLLLPAKPIPRDPDYVETAIRRWQTLTGDQARNVRTVRC
jgi:hypothetical protein